MCWPRSRGGEPRRPCTSSPPSPTDAPRSSSLGGPSTPTPLAPSRPRREGRGRSATDASEKTPGGCPRFVNEAYIRDFFEQIDLHTARYFAVALGLLVGVAAYVAMQWLNSPAAWWMILTFFVVVQPYYTAASHRVVARVVGTLAGAVLAIVVAEFLKDQPVVITVVALVLTVAAPWANMTRP